jgi:hypothetical protein
MAIKDKIPQEHSKRQAQKLKNPNTRGKNFAGQTHGQFEQDTRRRAGQYTQAGEPPIMQK